MLIVGPVELGLRNPHSHFEFLKIAIFFQKKILGKYLTLY